VKDSKSPDTLYQSWATNPQETPFLRVVESVQPTINYTLNSLGIADDPYLKNKARVVAADAIKTYDPSSGANLSTWVSQQMMRMRRLKRQAQAVADVPDRVQVDAYKIHQAEQSFIDKHNREPDMEELSDAVMMPVKRIEKVRNSFRKTPAEGALEGAITSFETDFERDAIDYVYSSADLIDRKIIEMKTGYGGKPAMEPKDIAMRLKLTPTQLSRRSKRLAIKIQDITKALEEV
jgi:DNA-directed RNA polymerase specialized sigma subunit